jgi:hypothetical protein
MNLEHLCSTEQEIHVSVKVRDSNSTWLLSAIYASPRRSESKVLWNNLSVIADLLSLPWVMVGDFNDILSSEEKWGGNKPSASRMAEFHACLNSCSLIDLGFSGPKYTWTNSQDVSSLIMQRLDRALANPEWRFLFPEANVTHLPRTHLDHCSILLTLHHNPLALLPVRSGLKAFGSLTLNSPVSLLKLGHYLPLISLKLSITLPLWSLLGTSSTLVIFSKRKDESWLELGVSKLPWPYILQRPM